MARYYFDQQNGAPIRDDEGVELPGVRAVRAAALEVLIRALGRDPEAFWTTGMHAVEVRDADGLAILRLDLTGTLSPLVRHKAPWSLAPRAPGR